MGLISRVSSRTYREFYQVQKMQNSHPFMKSVARLMGIRNHKPWLRQKTFQFGRDYPPAMMPAKPNDELSGVKAAYTLRDTRREVMPPRDVNNIKGVNDTKYPFPGYTPTWTLSKDEAFMRDVSHTGTASTDGWYATCGDLKEQNMGWSPQGNFP